MLSRTRSLAVFALILLCGTAAGAAPVTLEPGKEQACLLTSDAPLAVYRLEAPADAEVRVIALADLDVDLFVHSSELSEEDLGDAERVANSLDGLESVLVPPAAVEAGPEKRVLFVHVHDPEAESRDLLVRVVAFTGADRVLLPGRRVRVSLEPGEDRAVRFLGLLAGVDVACVRAESAAGHPSLRVEREGAVVEGAARSGWSSAVLAASDHDLPGLWKVEIGRPEGVSAETACRFALEVSWITKLPPADDERRIVSDPFVLAGESGTREFAIVEDDWQVCVLDVLPGTHGFDLETDAPGADIDLYATRDAPVETKEANWSYASWREGDSEFLHVGGPKPLPVGRYWIRIVNHSGSGDSCTLRWKRRAGPRLETLKPPDHRLLPDAPARIVMEENQPIQWVALPEAAGPGAHLQVLGSDKDVDLFLARADTRSVVARSTSILNDEHLRIDEDLILPPGTGLLAGIFRWSVAGRAAAGDLHLGVESRPEPPDGYLPPYPGWGKTASDRALAAAVEIVTDHGGGSGVVVGPGGLILTCHHVVEDEETIIAAFPLGQRGRPRQAFFAKVVLDDEDLDLALLELREDVTGRPAGDHANLAFVPIGRPGELRLGDPLRVIAYGNSGSSRFGSNLLMLAGVLAGVETEGSSDRWLITDARLGDGNSGGGYYNDRFELVGIHDMGVGEEGERLAYARPVSMLPPDWLRRIAAGGGRVPKTDEERGR